MLGRIVLLAVGIVVAARPGWADRQFIDTEKHLPPDYYDAQTEWAGGLHTLPYGLANPAAVAAHALTMPEVQRGMARMAARGYQRRVDLDAAGTKPGYSCAVIAYQKPGYDPLTPGSQQPVILVITRSYEVPDVGYTPTTQVFCGMAADSSNVPLPTVTPTDSAIVIVGVASSDPVAAALGFPLTPPLRDDETFSYHYCSHESGDFRDWREYTSPGMQELWNSWAGDIWRGGQAGVVTTVGGFISSPPTSFYQAGGRLCIGGLMGMYVADVTFWGSPPDTTHR